MIYVVTLPFDPTLRPHGWAQMNCPSFVNSDYPMVGYNVYDPTKREYQFKDEKDAVWFTLKWS